MKYILPFLILMLNFPVLIGQGQTVNPTIGFVEHNGANRTCLIVQLDPKTDVVEDAWVDYVKDRYKVKLKGTGFLGTGNLLLAEQVVIPEISSKRMDFYTNIEARDGVTEMKVFAALGTDVYIEPEKYSDEYEAMRNALHEFLKKFLPEYYREQIVNIEKNIKSLKKDSDRLDKKYQKKEKKINALEEEMSDNRAEKSTLIQSQEEQEILLKKRKKALTSILKELGDL